ncbi:MAG: CopG family transcriptional regulator [Actinomycetota bacterium]
MERTQIYLEEELKEGLRSLAEREGRSLAAVVRDAAAEYLSRHADGDETDPLLALIGIGRSASEDGALNHDHYLYGALKESE